MPSSDSGVVWDMGEIRARVNSLPKNINNMIAAIFERQAINVQDYARSNARWADRTGNARNGLFAKASRNGNSHEIVLYHTVPYGIWLEVRWAGKYAIIVPTIQTQAPKVMGSVQNLMARLAA